MVRAMSDSTLRRFGSLMLLAGIVSVTTKCSESVGACEGFSDFLNASYCNDGWTESECAEWDAMEVNAADWFFHEGQTCEQRGF